MKTGTRDMHSPANMDPATYTPRGTIYQGPTGNVREFLAISGMPADMIRQYIDEMTNKPLQDLVRTTSSYSGNWRAGRTCDHCGTHFHYGEVFEHANGDLIVVGWQCAEEWFGLDSKREVDRRRMKRRILGEQKRGRIALAVREFLNQAPGLEDAFHAAQTGDGEEREILRDMKRRLLEWGRLSDKQVAFALKLGDRIKTGDTAAERKKAAREARQLRLIGVDAWQPGRQTVAGVVKSVREPDQFADFPAWKWLIEEDNGRRAWGSVPRSIVDDCNDPAVDLKGARVQLTATINPKDDDPHFAFYARPTKAAMID